MKILLITPGISKKYNDNYFAYNFIAKSDNKLLVISQREHINKGKGTEINQKFESDGNILIHRVFETLKQQNSLIYQILKFPKIKNFIQDFDPDIIFCEELSNLNLAVRIKKKFNIPLVLRVEFAHNKDYPYRTFGRFLNFFKFKLTGDYFPIIIGKLIWNLATKNSDSIISCYFEDSKLELKNSKLKNPYYVPWPTFLPEFEAKIKKNDNRIVFAGSFDKHKNLKELKITIPLIIKNTHIKEVYIIGTGEDEKIIEELKENYPDNIFHIRSLSRIECLKLISSSYLSYTTAKRGGWGFIGDSFAAKTPVIFSHNHYGFNDNIDSIFTEPEQIDTRINEIYKNNDLYEKISLGGYQRFIKNHTAEGVGRKFIEICSETLNRN
jgi:glycosyltransferase involved in cell wall biosynthesis